MSTHGSLGGPEVSPGGGEVGPGGQPPQDRRDRGSSATPDTPQGSPPAFGEDTVNACTAAVNKFRTGAASKIEATYEILAALGSVPDVPKAMFEQAGQVYISMLDSWARSQQSAQQHGRLAPDGDDRNNQRPTSPQEEPAQSPTPGGDSRSLVGTKRRRAPVCDVDSDDEYEEGRVYGKKKPLDLASLPWFEGSERLALPEPLERTRTLIELFAEEPKRWKTYFTNRSDCPHLPDSEWTNIIAGKAVNLDAVHSAIFSVSLDTKHKERVGRLSIAIDDVTPSKAVTNHGDWLAAWQCASAGIRFIFRHRAAELDAYRDHISQFFTVVGDANRSAVIAYDKGVRLRVAGRRDLLLTVLLQFLDLQTQWISGVGAGSGGHQASAGPSRSSGRPRKRDPCHRWNDGRCPNFAKDCNYAHCCEKCRSVAHTARACPGGA